MSLDANDTDVVRCLRELDRRLTPAIDRILAARGTTWEAYRLTLPPLTPPPPASVPGRLVEQAAD